MQPKTFMWDDRIDLRPVGTTDLVVALSPETGTAVEIEPGSGIVVAMECPALPTGTTPTLDVVVEASDDGGSTYRPVLIFPQVTEVNWAANAQKRYLGFAVLPPLDSAYKAAGGKTVLLRYVATLTGTTADFGAVVILVAGVQLPSNAPTGLVDTVQLV